MTIPFADYAARVQERLERDYGIPVITRDIPDPLTGDLDGALGATEESLRQHARLPMPFELARTLVVRGQIQRRHREKLAAKASLEEALEIFESRGAALWARKARTELGRLGLHPGAGFGLTRTEQRVADLAASGLTNREVADQLFISPKTVEANLSRIYAKLGVRSRTEMAARMADRAGADPHGDATAHDRSAEGKAGVVDLRLTETLQSTPPAPDRIVGDSPMR